MNHRKFKYNRPSKSKFGKKQKATMLIQQKKQKDKTGPNKPVGQGKPLRIQTMLKQVIPLKFPSVFAIGGLLTIILVIPTLIVTPFVSGDEQEDITVEKEMTEVALTADDSPFSVAVMRNESEEVEDIPLENYVARVVASEMPAEFELEALKAQSLAARTYIINHMIHQGAGGNTEDVYVTDTVKHQVYKDEAELRQQWGNDYHWKMNKINEAVVATKGEILTYDNTTITPAFFSTSNGYTENSEDYWESELPYLRSVESPWDEDSPKFLDQKVFTIEEVEQLLAIDLPDRENVSVEISRTESDRVHELTIAGNTFSGRDIREDLGLQSSDFTIEQKNNHLIFKTEGFGHGIGMSQYGANGMAKEGKDYREIVQYYYQGVEISEVTDTAPMLVSR
ncbi:stage II sporulation protein D [Oceanobacillus halotolerans]|uniref:stage II sporulation protein D n=1 Tax=Oceanobacillus halotolerans TaxID=2663380 RepID=UPI001CF7B6F4|nr:stage II sporulation protein D [Oceanobacillus halotolerans]